MPSSAPRLRSVKEDTQEVVLRVVDFREACLVVRPVVDFLEAFRAVTQEAHLVDFREVLLVVPLVEVLLVVPLVEVLLVASQAARLVVLQAVGSLEGRLVGTLVLPRQLAASQVVRLADRLEASPEAHQVVLLEEAFQAALPVELLVHLLQRAVSQEAHLVAFQVVCQAVALQAAVSQAACLLAHLSRPEDSQEALLMAALQASQEVLQVDHQAVSQVACLPVHLNRLEVSQAAHLAVSQAVFPTGAHQESQHQQAASPADTTASPTLAHLNLPAPSPSTTSSRPPPHPLLNAKIPLSQASRSSTPLMVSPLAVLLVLPTHLDFHSHSLASPVLHQASQCRPAAHPTPSHPTLQVSRATMNHRFPCQLKLLGSLVHPYPPVDSQASRVAHLAQAFLRCRPLLRPSRVDRAQLVGSRLSRASRRTMGAKRAMAGGGTQSWIC
jgi:hypothetical protein